MTSRSAHLASSAIIGIVFLLYDLWLIGVGLFHPGVVLLIMAWMTFLLAFCVRHRREATAAAN